jgi:triosephosphate isomerase
MKQKKYTVIANWKMNPILVTEAKAVAKGISKVATKLKKTDVVIAPSFIHIPLLNLPKNVFLGSQDVFWDTKGAFTGFVSTEQISSLGVSYVIVGHSERRILGETDEMVNKKIKAVLNSRMVPILCIGEEEHDSSGVYLSFLSNQIKSAFKGISRSDFEKVIIAYEPIWAIGKGAKDSMDATKLHETVLYIQKILGELYGREGSLKSRIIYGGSVKEENALDLIVNGEVKGFLIGGASLKAETFNPILKIVDGL